MSDIEFINEEIKTELGMIVSHKIDERRMVIIDFGKSKNHASPLTKDKSKLICKYFCNASNTYKTDEFRHFEFYNL